MQCSAGRHAELHISAGDIVAALLLVSGKCQCEQLNFGR